MSDEDQRKIFSKNLNYYVYLSQKQQKDIAEELGYNQKTFNGWCTGLSMPSMGKVQKIADYFNIGKSDLLDDKSALRDKPKIKGIKIPVFNTIPNEVSEEQITDTQDWEEITEDLAATGEFFALKIKGQSMDPRISDGDIVIVRLQSDADSGSIVIARIGNNEDVTCKKMLKSKDGITMMPFNPSYEPLYYTNEEVKNLPVTIIGRVVEQRRKF